MAKLICQSLLLGFFCIAFVMASGATLDFQDNPVYKCIAACDSNCVQTCRTKGFNSGACYAMFCCCFNNIK
ncbi:unnamed protein product [Lathyrus oleraceus]